MSMLQKRERLTTRQFDHYFKTGKRWQFPHCTIIYSAHTARHGAVVVGKKVAKRAVVRNQLRRRAYGVLYRALVGGERTGVYIVLLKPSYVTLPRRAANAELTANIATVLKKT